MPGSNIHKSAHRSAHILPHSPTVTHMRIRDREQVLHWVTVLLTSGLELADAQEDYSAFSDHMTKTSILAHSSRAGQRAWYRLIIDSEPNQMVAILRKKGFKSHTVEVWSSVLKYNSEVCIVWVFLFHATLLNSREKYCTFYSTTCMMQELLGFCTMLHKLG